MMRNDEEYAKESIKIYLEEIHYPPFKIVCGENPPDYYIDSNNNKIPLEITTAESIYNEENGKSKKRTSIEAVAEFSDQLNNKFKKIISKGRSLLISFKVPIKNFSKFKNDFTNILDKLIKSKIFENRRLDIYGEIVKVVEIKHDNDKRKAIIGVISAKNPIVNIHEQTQLILNKIIKEKGLKFKKINNKNYSGEKWLGIINNYPLADANTFKIEINKINHNFTRIFLIEEKNEVTEIMNSK